MTRRPPVSPRTDTLVPYTTPCRSHHAESRLAQVAREELRLADSLLRPAGFLDDLEAIAPWIRQATTAEGREALRDDTSAHRARDAFNRGMQSLAAEAAASPFPDLLEEARSFSAQALASLKDRPTEDRSEERRVGKECVSTCRSRWSP